MMPVIADDSPDATASQQAEQARSEQIENELAENELAETEPTETEPTESAPSELTPSELTPSELYVPETAQAIRATRASARLDAVAAAASDLARAAAIDVGGEHVGEWLSVVPDGERLVVHRFAATLPGYVGWYWAVSIARASRGRTATVNEVVLLPGAEALRPPEWIPWSERIKATDLRPGDVVPTTEDDPRLVPGYTLSGDPGIDGIDARGDADPDVSMPVMGAVGAISPALAREWGFGRARVLSYEGRWDAAARWIEGEGGPDTPMARQAPDHCDTCGFYLPLAGSLGVRFGACGNAISPSDGTVVTIDHGCGAHSESLVVLSAEPAAP
jgi:hypothetical protein